MWLKMPVTSIKNGKKIAIGGSITETTRATVAYTPSNNRPDDHGAAFLSHDPSLSKHSCKNAEG